MLKPNSYNVTVVSVERLYHPKHGRSWSEVVWQSGDVRGHAKTFPGGDVNSDIERWIGKPGAVDIVLNGRRQIIAIRRHGA